ncbi:MAG: hypothetical protein FWH26_11720, partial [Oscillospiraceae bacterium]|nr:hypothetical protein [Oscillospiraceae bacterium]
ADGFGGGGGGGTVGTFSGSGNTIYMGLILGVVPPPAPYNWQGYEARAFSEPSTIAGANASAVEWSVESAVWSGLRAGATVFSRGDEPVLTVSLAAKPGYLFVNGQLPNFALFYEKAYDDLGYQGYYSASAPYLNSSSITVTFRFAPVPRIPVSSLSAESRTILGINPPVEMEQAQPEASMISANAGKAEWTLEHAQWNVGVFAIGTEPVLRLELAARDDYEFDGDLFWTGPPGNRSLIPNPFTLSGVSNRHSVRLVESSYGPRRAVLEAEFSVFGATVLRAPGSQGTEGNTVITGLLAGTRYAVRRGDQWYGVGANGTLVAPSPADDNTPRGAAAASVALTTSPAVTSITGLDNGHVYDVYAVDDSGTDGASINSRFAGKNALLRASTTNGEKALIAAGAGSPENDTKIILYWTAFKLREAIDGKTLVEEADHASFRIRAGGGDSDFQLETGGVTQNNERSAKVDGKIGDSHVTVSGVGEFTTATFKFTGKVSLGPGSQGTAGDGKIDITTGTYVLYDKDAEGDNKYFPVVDSSPKLGAATLTAVDAVAGAGNFSGPGEITLAGLTNPPDMNDRTYSVYLVGTATSSSDVIKGEAGGAVNTGGKNAIVEIVNTNGENNKVGPLLGTAPAGGVANRDTTLILHWASSRGTVAASSAGEVRNNETIGTIGGSGSTGSYRITIDHTSHANTTRFTATAGEGFITFSNLCEDFEVTITAIAH